MRTVAQKAHFKFLNFVPSIRHNKAATPPLDTIHLVTRDQPISVVIELSYEGGKYHDSRSAPDGLGQRHAARSTPTPASEARGDQPGTCPGSQATNRQLIKTRRLSRAGDERTTLD